jgi:D-arabinonate dehydratase
VATGELESTRWGFAELLERKAADILQPDAAVVGGVTEWLKVAHMAAAFDVPIAPHYHWDLHTQLVATIPNGIFVEYFVRESGVKVFDDIIANALQPKDGFVAPRTAPGFGIEYNENAIKGYTIARSV